MNPKRSDHTEIPVLPVRDTVIYPHTITALFVGRKKSVRCLEAAMNHNKQIILTAQKETFTNDPKIKDLFSIGTLSSILQMLKLPDGTAKILIEGLNRVKIITLKDNGKYFVAQVEYFDTTFEISKENKILNETAIKLFETYIKLNKKIPNEILHSLIAIKKSNKLADTIASHMKLKLANKQRILEIANPEERLEYVMTIIESEIDILKIEQRIRARIRNKIEKNQREYYLNEQIKAIQKELGEETDNSLDEYKTLKQKIDKIKLPKDTRKKIIGELNKLKMTPVLSAEATVLRNYMDWIIQIPWNKKSKIKKDLTQAQKILDHDHYGLNHVKERILEYLAVQNRTSKNKGTILCLVGPPGVGKTSLGKSIANATGRKYIRMALGGINDEAEIRGHRKTYVGSMPGKIMQKITKIGVKNPLFLLDEIDKIYFNMRGDPASALLEVLDPEQNSSFNDHYLEVDFDLSNVMFVATSNSMKISNPLLDRMEVIRLSGYTEDEKLNIAKKYLLPKQIKNNALKKGELIIQDHVLTKIIRHYTYEAGVRNLEREISKLCRKAVKKLLINKSLKNIIINENNLKKYLGIEKTDYGCASTKNQIGQATGLAWTEIGGDLLTIEAACVPGKGKLTYTGSLGEVMQESIETALSAVRIRAKKLNIQFDFYEKKDIHVHMPEGATPKDGPSAGITICTALVSSLTNNPVRADVAMTGEITLRGLVLPIGGLKEKLLAAHRGGIKTVLIPYKNSKDLEEIPKNVLSSLKIHLVKTIEDVFEIALKNAPFQNIKKELLLNY